MTQSYTYTYPFSLRFFSHIVHHRLLGRVLCESEVLLIHNTVLLSGVERSDSISYILKYTHIFFSRFFSLIGYYKILSIVPVLYSRSLNGYFFYLLIQRLALGAAKKRKKNIYIYIYRERERETRNIKTLMNSLF